MADNNNTISTTEETPQTDDTILDFLHGVASPKVDVKRTAEWLHSPLVDKKWLQAWLRTMRGPTHEKYDCWAINVVNCFRLHMDASNIEFGSINNKRIAFHGCHVDDVYSLLATGFTRFERRRHKNARLGDGYYFTDCSTKALFYSAEKDAYSKERAADLGNVAVRGGDTRYFIFVCALAMGSTIHFDMVEKRNLYANKADSVASIPIYSARHSQTMAYEFEDTEYGVQHSSVCVPTDGQRYDEDFMQDVHRDLLLSRYSDFVVFRAEQIQPLFLVEIHLAPAQLRSE